MPFIAGLAGLFGANKAQSVQNKAQQDQNLIAEQEMRDKQQAFQQLINFLTPYLKSGSPFLQNIQSAAAGQNAQQTNDAAGTFRSEMGATGTGFGPSGSTAAGLARIGSNAASMGASNYLQNLLNNEQIKFQAAKGIQDAGSMAGSSQNQPSVSTQLPAANTASSVGALGNVLASAVNPFASPAGTPTTGGWAL